MEYVDLALQGNDASLVSLLLLFQDLKLFLVVSYDLLSFDQLQPLGLELSLELLNHLVLLFEEGSRRLILSVTRLLLRLPLLFLCLSKYLLSSFLLFFGYFGFLSLPCRNLSSISHVLQLLQPLFLLLCTLEKLGTLWNRAAVFLELILQHDDLHLVGLNLLLSGLKELSQLWDGVLAIHLRVVLH